MWCQFLYCFFIRLGLLNKDSASSFGISITLWQQIFHGWLTAMHKTLGSLIYWPSKEEIRITKPPRYRHLPDLRAIIDYSEVFVETAKDPSLQTKTWSEYKHHNTVKFLIAVAPYNILNHLIQPFACTVVTMVCWKF